MKPTCNKTGVDRIGKLSCRSRSDVELLIPVLSLTVCLLVVILSCSPAFGNGWAHGVVRVCQTPPPACSLTQSTTFIFPHHNSSTPNEVLLSDAWHDLHLWDPKLLQLHLQSTAGVSISSPTRGGAPRPEGKSICCFTVMIMDTDEPHANQGLIVLAGGLPHH